MTDQPTTGPVRVEGTGLPPGTRVYHFPLDRLGAVTGDYDPTLGEIPVTFDDGTQAHLSVRSLDPVPAAAPPSLADTRWWLAALSDPTVRVDRATTAWVAAAALTALADPDRNPETPR